MEEIVKIICILDRSGSMYNIMDEMVGSLNSFIEEQKKVPGKADFTLVAFDDEYEVVYDQVELKKVPVITRGDVYPRGMTALYDAVGKTLSAIDADNAIVLIQTDGYENASKEYTTKERLKEIIEVKKAKGWDITFVGADFDAYDTALAFGTKSFNVAKTQEGMESLKNHYVNTTTTYRSSVANKK